MKILGIDVQTLDSEAQVVLANVHDEVHRVRLMDALTLVRHHALKLYSACGEVQDELMRGPKK